MTRVVHCKREDFDIYIGRPTCWGNQFTHLPGAVKPGMILVATRQEAIRRYREWIMQQPELIAKVKRELRGKILGCWCAPLPCHGRVLAEIADSEG